MKDSQQPFSNFLVLHKKFVVKKQICVILKSFMMLKKQNICHKMAHKAKKQAISYKKKANINRKLRTTICEPYNDPVILQPPELGRYIEYLIILPRNDKKCW